ncbi:MAG: energy transducer TonB [Terracidiphilus sp.]|nr:energy transducer TonB [Terracidiphilus sp.]MDR3798794.1 energy transducer TonB [Terracidiphilus sp.]
MCKLFGTVSLLIIAASCAAAQNPATSPANEPREVGTVRSLHSMGPDLKVPLCPAHFHDSLRANSIAGPQDKDVTPPKAKTTVPAPITQDAVMGAGKTHIGNFEVIVSVIVDTKGVPHDLCLRKSSGYGLDASAAAAVGQYRFDPAKQGGKPVRARVPVEVRFLTPTPPPMGTPRTGEPPK